MSVWDDLPGQEGTVATLTKTAQLGNPTHAWLFTGPPGSGRSNAARAFAAALECEAPAEQPRGCGVCEACRLVLGGAHPDVAMISTENVSYAIADVRELIGKAQDKPSRGDWRIIVIEDADRMTERTTNVLLKAIEEPPPHTVWILCAPSPADVLVTIRSRCRGVSLRVPDTASVTELLVRRDGLTPEQAAFAARVSQGHIGVARRLARDEGARTRREQVVALPLHLPTLPAAMEAAARFLELTTAEAESEASSREQADEARLRAQLGLAPEEAIPPQLRSHFKGLADAAKRRARRGTTDAIDRALIDLTTFFRDTLTLQLGTAQELVNEHLGEPLRRYAAGTSAAHSLAAIDAIAVARRRIIGNVQALLALESLMTSLIASPRNGATS
ncbi:DNA polymerase III subunit delta' [Galactobacter valiniphilus]|uniref:DNA polymerase III subunit delta n=1 Tax=Galactobacter valiniphilus TaxID=2676122 RepID=A0A399JCT0_9MICC|nr:DNA polymerase III subunit delta' [Galactobacter valiniphilus]RII41832.1 DNA polymerase III subunit delta' [Galactobacter valiniphilus]